MKHKYESYDNDPHNPITYCSVCTSEGRELSCDCPGEPIDQFKKNAIALGDMDYINGQWVTPQTAGSVGKC